MAGRDKYLTACAKNLFSLRMCIGLSKLYARLEVKAEVCGAHIAGV